MSGGKIARELGISRAALSFATHRLGIKCPPPEVEICPVCGWRGVISHHKPDHCAHYLQIKKLRIAGMSRREIERALGVSGDALSLAFQRLGVERLGPKIENGRPKVEICQACGWKGVITYHKPSDCARFLHLKKLSIAGMSRGEIGRELGISETAVTRARVRLDIRQSGPKVEICQLCGWRGWSSLSKAHPCARNLEIKRMYLGGMSLRDVGRELAMDSSRVLRVLKAESVNRRPAGRPHNPSA